MSLSDLEIATLVERYKRERDRFEKLATIVSRKLSAKLRAEAIPHVPTFRTKEPDSLWNKLGKAAHELSYDQFRREFSHAIKDLAGVRVLLYRPQDFARACAIVADLFKVPSPGEFHRTHEERYRAEHRVIVLRQEDIDADRASENLWLTCCEIQIVMIDDHIWNEFEHDICYKTPHGNPTDEQHDLLNRLRDNLDVVRGTVVELMSATDRQRIEASAPIESPDDLRRELANHTGLALGGDYEGLLELLLGVMREVTRAVLQRLPLSRSDLNAAKLRLKAAGVADSAEDLSCLVVAALWSLYSRDFTEIVYSWPGRPGPLKRAVRALDRHENSQ